MMIPVTVFGPFPKVAISKTIRVFGWVKIKWILKWLRIKLKERQWISIDGKFTITPKQLSDPVKDYRTYSDLYIFVVNGREK